MWNLHKSDKTQMPAGLEDPVLMEGCGHIGLPSSWRGAVT